MTLSLVTFKIYVKLMLRDSLETKSRTEGTCKLDMYVRDIEEIRRDLIESP